MKKTQKVVAHSLSKQNMWSHNFPSISPSCSMLAAAEGFQKNRQLQQKENLMNEIPRNLLQRGIPPVMAMQKLESIIYANRQIRRLEKKKWCPNQFQANSNPLNTGVHKIKCQNLLLKTTFKISHVLYCLAVRFLRYCKSK